MVIELARSAGAARAGKERLIASKMAGEVHKLDLLRRLMPPLARLGTPAIGHLYNIPISRQRGGCDVSPPQAHTPAWRRNLADFDTAGIVGNRARHGSDITFLISRTGATLEPRTSAFSPPGWPSTVLRTRGTLSTSC
jgi:hypothetical protein